MCINTYNDLSPWMKRGVRLFTFLLLIGITCSSFAFALWYVVSAKDIHDKIGDTRQITVSGTGKVPVKPTIATFTAGIITQGTKVRDAQIENSRRSGAIIDFLKSKGVDEKDITTINYSISPNYQYYTPQPCAPDRPCAQMTVVKPPEIAGYQVDSTIQIKVRDLAKTDDLLDGVASNGANNVGSLSFTLDDKDLEALRNQARQMAIQNATKNARSITGDLGVRLERIVGFSESGSAPYYPMQAKFALGGATTDAATAPTPQVQPGEQEINANVTVVYQFR